MESPSLPNLNIKTLETYLKQLKNLFESNPVKAVVLAVPINHLLNLFYDDVPLEKERAERLEEFLKLWEEAYKAESLEHLSALLQKASQLKILPFFD